MRISDWSSDVCSSDLGASRYSRLQQATSDADLSKRFMQEAIDGFGRRIAVTINIRRGISAMSRFTQKAFYRAGFVAGAMLLMPSILFAQDTGSEAQSQPPLSADDETPISSEETTSELQALI